MNHTLAPSQLFVQVLAHTPVWVWGLLALLIALGLVQRRERQLPRTRIVVIPLTLAAYSLSGAVSAFGVRPEVLAAWTLATLVVSRLCRRLPWRRAPGPAVPQGPVVVPGSGWPLVLMLAIFTTRYVVAVAHAMQPAWAQQGLGLPVAGALVYGALSGVLVGRAWALLGRHGQSPADRSYLGAEAA